MSSYAHAVKDGVEQWKVVLWAPAYEVSDRGRVRSVARTVVDSLGRTRQLRGVALALSRNNYGHLYVRLRSTVRAYVHRLVLEAFIGPCPAGHECCHRNDDPSDNRVENLYWGTRADNMLDRVANGKHHMARRTHCKHGHEYTPGNTFYNPSKSATTRLCKRCDEIRVAEYTAKRRADRDRLSANLAAACPSCRRYGPVDPACPVCLGRGHTVEREALT
ncbi:HNH endonuclease [Tessaracoccus massiliensis]|uniref:HNH endonuclease n=1 Tax=Tessaracoccus massiliensis TaxID=1522311 RepID=UPI000693E7F5|nr:HNH endonuclease [Tessaracoccus massiliensis]